MVMTFDSAAAPPLDGVVDFTDTPAAAAAVGQQGIPLPAQVAATEALTGSTQPGDFGVGGSP